MVSDTRLSRAVAHALRHAPWVYELELDEHGWAPVDQLLEALQRKGAAWSGIDRNALDRMVAGADKRRYELDGDRIRALYGHSVHSVVSRTPSSPPDVLFHGTAPQLWPVIQEQGLRPMRRQYVHLSRDVATATEVGRRKSRQPMVLTVHARDAARSGVRFYEGNDLVWLADSVPTAFIELRTGAVGGVYGRAT